MGAPTEPRIGGRDTPPEPEFEDEPPGAVLFERRPRPVLWAWGAANLLLVAALGGAAVLFPSVREGPAQLPLSLLWLFLPISALIGLLFTLFVAVNLPLGTPRGRIIPWALGLHLAACAVWAAFRWGAGAGF